MSKYILKNFSLLLAIEITSMVIPFIIIPFLIKAFDVGIYGRLIFVQVIFSYFIILIQFGFNLTATKLIAEHKANRVELSKITTSVLIIKVILFIFSSLAIIVISQFMPKNETLWLNLGLLIIFAEVLNLQWFYQAIQRLKVFSTVTLVGKFSILLGVLLLVHDRTDDIKYLTILGLSGVLPSLFLMVYFFKSENIFFEYNKDFTLRIAKEGINIFFSRISVIISERILITILGLQDASGNKVAIFDLASKFVTVFNSPYTIFNNIYYPIAVTQKSTYKVFKIISMLLISSVIGYLLIFLCSKDLISFYLPNINSNLVYNVLLILALTVPINIVSQYTGNCILIVNNKIGVFTKSILYSSVIYFIVLLISYNNVHSLVAFALLSLLFPALVMIIRVVSSVRIKL